MKIPRIAIVAFPGNNCEVESMRAIRTAGMEALYFRWNDDRGKLADVDGYFLPGGFAYEDRGRSGMVAARDPLMDFIGAEAENGKVVIGNCNGAQVLVESGLIPNGRGLQMSLARNAIKTTEGIRGLPFLSEWVHVTRSCEHGRCATGFWDGVLHMPMAHGEGRFTTRDKDLLQELKNNDQIAFSYCDQEEKVSTDAAITPNGSLFGIAGICNPEGNVVALMPHPERTENGAAYFASLNEWFMKPKMLKKPTMPKRDVSHDPTQLLLRSPKNVEIFIETIITNNEERTVEQAARRIAPTLSLRQWKYLCVPEAQTKKVLGDLTVFNANKERAFVRRGIQNTKWNADRKSEESLSSSFAGSRTLLIRRDIPDTGAVAYGEESETGIAYGIEGISEQELCSKKLLEVFANPHASTLERLSL